MKLPTSVAAATILLSSIAPSFADDQIKAQPITLSAAVGAEQSDFFITEAKVPIGRGQVDILAHLMFTAKTKTLNNGKEHRALFKQKLERNSPSVVFYTTVNAQAPLRKLNTFVVPQGTVFNDFKRNRNRIGPRQGRKQQFFKIPGKGLYQSTGGATAVLVRPETLLKPISSYAFRAEDHTATDTDSKDEQFRVLLGASTPAKGYEPYISTGTALGTRLLKDVVPGATGSEAQQFTSYFFPPTATDEAFWVGNDPAASGGAAIFRSNVQVTGRVIRYGTETVGTAPVVPSQLTGSSAGLFFTGTPGGEAATALYRYNEDTGIYDRVSMASQVNFEQLTPNYDTSYGNIGFRATDTQAGVSRFGRYSSFSGTVLFPEVANVVGVHTSAPEKITSTGNFYYFTAAYDGQFRYLMRSFTGSSTLDFVYNTVALNFIYDVSEFCYVALDGDSPNASDGSLYFVGGSFFGGVYVANVLFKMDPNNGDGIAMPVRTTAGNLVIGAKNLRSVRNSSISRLYFCAPVNSTTNAEFAAGGTDYGTKPWVVNVE